MVDEVVERGVAQQLPRLGREVGGLVAVHEHALRHGAVELAEGDRRAIDHGHDALLSGARDGSGGSRVGGAHFSAQWPSAEMQVAKQIEKHRAIDAEAERELAGGGHAVSESAAQTAGTRQEFDLTSATA